MLDLMLIHLNCEPATFDELMIGYSSLSNTPPSTQTRVDTLNLPHAPVIKDSTEIVYGAGSDSEVVGVR